MSTPDTDTLLNPADFQSTEVHLAFRNAQTKIEIRDPQQIRFIEFIEKGLIVEVPTASAALSNTVMMRIELKQKDKVLQNLNVSGRVVKVEPATKEHDVISVELTQFQISEWDGLKNYFSNRQTEIETLFESMKGR